MLTHILFVLLLPLGARAAIIGLLYESPDHTVRVSTASARVEVTIKGVPPYTHLNLSRQMPSEGGSTSGLIAALEKGELPTDWIKNWVRPAPGDRSAVMLGLWLPSRAMSYRSAFAEITVHVDHVRAPAMSQTGAIEGEQRFVLNDWERLLSPEERAAFAAGDLDLGLVIQFTPPGAFDVETRLIRVTAEDLKTDAEVYASCVENLSR